MNGWLRPIAVIRRARKTRREAGLHILYWDSVLRRLTPQPARADTNTKVATNRCGRSRRRQLYDTHRISDEFDGDGRRRLSPARLSQGGAAGELARDDGSDNYDFFHLVTLSVSRRVRTLGASSSYRSLVTDEMTG